MSPKDRNKQRDDDLRGVLSSPAGRRFLWRLLTQSGLHGASYSESPTATAYAEGRRSVAIGLMREVQRVTPELYATALKEQLDAEMREALAIREAVAEADE